MNYRVFSDKRSCDLDKVVESAHGLRRAPSLSHNPLAKGRVTTPSLSLPRFSNESIMAGAKKRGRSIEAPTAATPAKRLKVDSALNSSPSQKLDIYVFGLGEYGELGLGPKAIDGKKPKSVRRPRINHFLDAATVGVVQIAVGGMHCVALTHDHKILTWGVNDNGALGRDTTWEAPTRDIDAGSDDDDDEDEDEGGLNPKESTPTAIPAEFFGKDPKTFVQVVATDSASFVLTDDGSVFGWGTFRVRISFFRHRVSAYDFREMMAQLASLLRTQ